jgi:prepilin-type processing-associated H-X9-DG protein
MFIVGILIAMVLPAVQYAREAGRRLQCQSHLRQVGIALQTYHDRHYVFPPGYRSAADRDGNDTGPGWGWASFILRDLEQASLAALVDFRLPIEAAQNEAARRTIVPIFLCPSDPTQETWPAIERNLTGNILGTICELASANYIGVFGTTEPGVEGDGMFYRDSHVGIRDVTDGTAVTILVGERSHELGTATWVGAVTKATLYPSPGSTAPPIVDNSSGYVLGHTGDLVGPSDPHSYANQFSSQHASGANFLFVDGHVQLISTTINNRVYRSLTTRAGGEAVGAF